MRWMKPELLTQVKQDVLCSGIWLRNAALCEKRICYSSRRSKQDIKTCLQAQMMMGSIGRVLAGLKLSSYYTPTSKIHLLCATDHSVLSRGRGFISNHLDSAHKA